MPPGTTSAGPVPLCQRPCRFVGCPQIFYVCQRCDRGQCYCSPECRYAARRLQHRAAAAKFQRTLNGRRRHALRQRAYRERQRARVEKIVTDPSFPVTHSAASCQCDTRPVPQPRIQPPASAPTRLPRPVPGGDLRCQFCGCRGYLPKRDLHEPDHSARHP